MHLFMITRGFLCFDCSEILGTLVGLLDKLVKLNNSLKKSIKGRSRIMSFDISRSLCSLRRRDLSDYI